MTFAKYNSLFLVRAMLARYSAGINLTMRNPRRQVGRWIARRVSSLVMPLPVVPNDDWFEGRAL